jgi:MGT family glycosyltransferase
VPIVSGRDHRIIFSQGDLMSDALGLVTGGQYIEPAADRHGLSTPSICTQGDSSKISLKKHFAFINVPAAGHVNPTLPLVEELVRRGHRVSYATGHSMLARIKAAGAEAIPLPAELPDLPPNVNFFPENFARMLEHALAEARNSFPLLLQHFERDRPDAVCYDAITLTGRALAEKLQIPDISLVPTFAGHENLSLREQLKHPRLATFCMDLAQFAAEYGVTRDLQPTGASPSPLNLVFIPKQFQIAPESFDERFCFLGPSLGRRADEQWQPKYGNAPLLFISLGTVFNNRPEFYRMCFEAFGDSGWQVAMAIGDQLDPAEFGQAPENFTVRPSFPQLAVLRHATAFLSHTGMNSTMESLYYGVPLVAVPQMVEQYFNACRVEQLGLGRRLEPDELTAEQLRRAVDEVATDEAVRANLTAMQRELRNCGGAAAGAEALEAYLLKRRSASDIVAARGPTASVFVFNPLAEGFAEDPYPYYEELRAVAPVYEHPLGSWILSRYDDVCTLLRSRQSVDEQHAAPGHRSHHAAGQSMAQKDPPDHTRLRRLVSKAFTPRAIAAMEPRVVALVDEALDRIGHAKQADLVAELAFPLPFTVISEMLGTPPVDHIRLRELVGIIIRSIEPVVDPQWLPEIGEAELELAALIDDIINWKRDNPGDDLLTALIAAEHDGDVLSDKELLDQVSILYIAGHETTANLIAGGALALLRNPDQLKLLREQPELATNAVEELLRYVSPIQWTRRITIEPFRVGGQEIPAGRFVAASLASANRDPNFWGSDAGKLQLRRPNANQHVAFGGGMHYCLGGVLARLQVRVAIMRLIQRFPGLDLEDVEWNGRINSRGPATLWVTTKATMLSIVA